MVEHFKNELRNYEFYKKSLKEINGSLSDVWYELTGVKAIRYDKPPGTFNKALATENQHELMNKIEILQKEEERIRKQIAYIEGVLGAIEDEDIRESIKEIYAHKKTFRKEAEKHYISYVTLYNKINEEIKKALARFYR